MVLEAVIQPLVELVAGAGAEALLGAVDSAIGGGSGSEGFYIDPEGLARYAEAMHRHAEDVGGHGEALNAKLETLEF
ncbi:hypothetical protein [Kitasatospora sp. NPDC057198]|uniref:hypothetical protein n=1 Tax=Kitasatospora sp. NPDC057198 TaxID=3346046 RepID=UPI0036346B5E